MTKKKFDLDIHIRLAEEIYKLDISNVELAKRLNCNPTNVRNWLSGANLPYAYYLAGFHRVGCDVIYILTGERHV